MLYIVMGVSGCGKSTVGKLLANKLGLPFFDADDFHSEENIYKMKNGIPLNDEDRLPWLTELSELIKKWENKGGVVLACSALKEKYRKILQSKANNKIQWVFLEGSLELILERLKKRKNHFMHENLITSQFMALEKPSYGFHLNISDMPEKLVELIVNNKLMNGSDFGIIGLGVMGKSLSLNLTHKKIKVSVYNRNLPGEEEFIARKFGQQYPDILCLDCHDELESFIHFLTRPRKILLMIKAGAPVDEMIDILLPYLEEGDIIIDGGNSFYKDTNRRIEKLAEHKINFIGLGISGGEEGALKGPSLMPGGDKEAYEETQPILELLAAKDKSGNPCCSYIGPDGSGHFIKMIHNGIEYAEMQLLAEVYSILRSLLGLSPKEIADLFKQWQKEPLNSYLLEITIDILNKKENDYLLLDKILDKAESKGTGSWSTSEALNLGTACNTISESVMARYLSAMKEYRTEAARLYNDSPPKKNLKELSLDTIKEGYSAA
ncbi:MAG: NADP-dependent phosphogluconate dehydrogenase, partial [Cytophagaceae bacterium]